MKINTYKSLLTLLFLAVVVACSTKKDTFLARNSHALSTKYNILYNGQVGLDKGIKSLQMGSDDNFWDILPIEKMQVSDEFTPEKAKNPDFELAETKATKAIQKHSMNIGGKEKNFQIDEAYLMLGKARYYDQRFVPALDAFNYILYKYPNSSKIYEAKVWREKTNMRLGNDAQVIKNISKLLDDRKVQKQVYADANALLAASFLNLEEKDSAVAKLKQAINFTKVNQEKARYRFVLGQLYQKAGYKDSAVTTFQEIIAMNRKAERRFVLQAHAKKAELFDYQNGDTALFVKTFDKLLKDRENRPFKDLILHQMAVFQDKQNNQKAAIALYNSSLKTNSKDSYLVASNYRNLGDMYFKNASYASAAKYYDSTLVKLNNKTREFAKIEKIRKNLDEVIAYEAIAQRNDSILKVVAMSPEQQNSFYENYIAQLKEKDEQKKLLEAKNKELQENRERNASISSADPSGGFDTLNAAPVPGMAPPSMNPIGAPQPGSSSFYFYNATTVAFGKVEFKKLWGDRSRNGNWRFSGTKVGNTAVADDDATTATDTTAAVATIEKPEYSTLFYTKQLPTDAKELDSIAKERNSAYYNLGIVYKEKFKENELAISKLEQLLLNNPEEKLVLPTLYNLFKLYQSTNTAKADAMKTRISQEFPNSRYAQIINQNAQSTTAIADSPETEYNKWYKLFEKEDFNTILSNIDNLIVQFSGDEIVSKFELLKANTLGKVKGLAAYKKAMQDVVDNYPNSEEGKSAALILKEQIPVLEQLNFKPAVASNYKILYQVGARDDEKTKALEASLKAFFEGENLQKLYLSYDLYTDNNAFITIHGIPTQNYAADILTVLAENKKYNLTTPAIIIASENYRIVQIKKNLESYLALEKK